MKIKEDLGATPRQTSPPSRPRGAKRTPRRFGPEPHPDISVYGAVYDVKTGERARSSGVSRTCSVLRPAGSRPRRGTALPADRRALVREASVMQRASFYRGLAGRA